MADLGEAELIARLAHYFKECEETCRALAQLRKDERWLRVVNGIVIIRQKCAVMASRRAA